VVDADFYRSTAETGIYFAPIVAVVSGLLSGLKKFWLATIVPVFSCPLLFAGVFKLISIMREWNVGVETDAGFGNFTPAAAAANFYAYTISLVITGLIIGAICSFLLVWLSENRKLA